MNLKLPFTPKHLLIFSSLLFLVWLTIVLNLSPLYATAVETDALAMINLLFPSFWIILALFIAVCFLAFTKVNSPRWLHAVLLAQLSLMLYYTPFLIGGFSWSPDSLWHGGVANYLPSILAGSNYSLTEYARSYPFSFLLTFGAQRLFQVDIVTYTLYVFPTISITLISTLAYFFISRISNKSTAFIAMLLALPALHYLEPHVSPFATGTVLLLLSLVLLTYKGARPAVANILVIIALVLTHPISPIFLGVYIASALIVTVLRQKKDFLATIFSKKIIMVNLAILLIFLSFFWVSWTFFEAAPNYVGVKNPVSNIISLSFLNNLVNAVEWTAGGQGFIYPQISQLSLFIYAVFMAGILFVFFHSLIRLIKNRGKVDAPIPLRLELALTAIISAAISYLLFSSSGERFLLGRGLIFFLLMGAICMASYLDTSNLKKFRVQKAAVFVFIIFLVLTFPIIAYSKEAYNTFTPPAEEGLSFLAANADLSDKTLSMTSSQQLAAFANLTQGLNLINFPPNMTTQSPDLIALRINSLYFMAMRYDGSFSNNSYTALAANLSNNSNYNKVYSNSQFEVFVKK